MIWVCRPGKDGIYFPLFCESNRIYLAWEGYNTDLSHYKTLKDFRKLVITEKNPKANTSISNWACQLYSFCVDMQIGDYVMIPDKHSKKYTLATICGDYEYRKYDELLHSRKIKILVKDIPRSSFNKTVQYSLGAFRTVFKTRFEEEILKVAKDTKNNHD